MRLEKNQPQKIRISLKNELIALGIWSLSILFILSLIENGTSESFTGILGSVIRNIFRDMFGASSFIIPIILIIAGTAFHRGRQATHFRTRFIGFVLLLISVSGILNLINPTRLWGGAAGDFFTDSILLYLAGNVGAVIILAIMVLAGLVLMFHMPALHILGMIIAALKKKSSLHSFNAARKPIRIAPAAKTRETPAKTGPIRNMEEALPKALSVSEKSSSTEDKSEYHFPSLELLTAAKSSSACTEESFLRDNAARLEETLANFGIAAKVNEIVPGPVITRYEMELGPGIKVSSVSNLENDIALALKAMSVRILAPIPGKAAVGVEIPNPVSQTVYLRQLLQSSEFQESPGPLAMAVGKTTSGRIYIDNLADMPHLLIAGSTGSGKSVFINTLILGFLFKASPRDIRFLLIDPKMVELPVYNGIPHLLMPVVTKVKESVGALRWIVQEMENRFTHFNKHGVRDILHYNETVPDNEHLPYIVVIIDELADLMTIAAQQVENVIIRLAQMSRAVGIHLILATQRPSVDVITGIIKANLPARIAFQVISKVDSRTILDMNGADALLGKGDMLYLASGAPKPVRIQAGYVTTKEIRKTVDFLKSRHTEAKYLDTEHLAQKSSQQEEDKEVYELMRQALAVARSRRQASASLFKGALHISDGKAANIMSLLETQGFIGPAQGSRPREVYLDRIDDFFSRGSQHA